MPLKPVRETPDPGYPSFEEFRRLGVEALRRLGVIVGVAAVAPGLSGCGGPPAPHTTGAPAVVTPPPVPPDAPRTAGVPVPPTEPTTPREPPERLPGKLIAPEPPEPNSGGDPGTSPPAPPANEPQEGPCENAPPPGREPEDPDVAPPRTPPPPPPPPERLGGRAALPAPVAPDDGWPPG